MQRKLIKNNEISSKPFLLVLLKIFNSIQDELKKLPAFDCRNLLELKGINQAYLHKNVAQRLIKKEHEAKLFRQTYDQISMMTKRKPRARRSDVIMKFAMVSDILLSRMKQQLSIKGEAKQLMLDNLLRLKDSFMSWGQNFFFSKNWCQEQSNILSKITDDYKLQYVFSELATTYATKNHTRSVSKHQNTDVQPSPQESPCNAEESSNFKSNRQINNQRHTVNYLLNRSERKSTKRYTKNVVNTDFDKKNHQQNTISQESIKSKEPTEQRQKKLKKKTNFFENDFGYLQPKNIEKKEVEESSESPSQSMDLASEQQENKKSAYFQSQNYIKSRKNLENITLFVNVKSKTKKRISNYLSSTSEVLGLSQSAIQDMIFMQEPTEGYKSRKFLTRKYIPDEPVPNIKAAKSEKFIARRSTAFKTNINSNIHPHYEKKPLIKVHKQSTEQLQEIRFERPQGTKKKYTTIKEENIQDPAVEGRATQYGDGKNMGEFYAQLGVLRSELKKETELCSHNRSEFFHQQGILWEEEKRRMQRVLDQRSRQLYFRQFEMACTTSNRDEQDALRAIRSDFVDFTQKATRKNSRNYKLDQMDLSKEKETV